LNTKATRISGGLMPSSTSGIEPIEMEWD